MKQDPMDLDFSGLTVQEVGEPVIVDGFQALPYYGPPGSKANCPDCGRELTLTGTGQFRGHKCVDGQMSAPSPGAVNPGGGAPSNPTPPPGKRKGKTPEKVQVLWVALSGSGAEWTAKEVVHKNTGAPKEMIPGLPDGEEDDMLRPVMDAIWPRLPKGAQKALVAIADEAGLVLAAIMWADYFKTLKAFQDDYRRMTQVQQAPPRPRSVPNPAQQQGAPNVPQGPASPESHPLGYTPFIPAAG